jgi:Tfp pilus assembly protein PilF
MSSVRPHPLAILAILICFIAPIYSNTLHVPWHYDDHPNILDNRRLHLTQFDVGSIEKTFFAQPGRERFYRPLPNLTFALNWYAGRDNPTGYHLVNICIHILTAFFLYLTVSQLLNTPLLSRRFDADDAVFISLFGAVLWAVNPVQTQAVTYIVQRMAQMAALFYVAGLYFYAKARLSPDRSGRWYLLPAGLMFCFAVFSKENAIMFPVTLILLEVLFFNTWNRPLLNRSILLSGGILLAVGIIGIVLFFNGKPLSFLRGYHGRPFSFSERVLTEPRIVLFYLSQLFYPLPERLSISHHVDLSYSLFSPWTTFFALLLVGLLIALAISLRHRYPLVSFAVLFFFVNHVVESTILPLELIFEHRNYLPSLFLFVPVAAVTRHLIKRYRTGNRWLSAAIIFCLLSIIIAWGRFTYERNRVWQSVETLWFDAMRKAPNQPGPINNIAAVLGWGKNSTPEKKELAVRMLERALEMEHPMIKFRARMYDNLGTLLMELDRPDQAAAAYQKAISLDPGFLKARYNLARFLARNAQWEKALTEIERVINRSGDHARSDYFQTRGYILLWMNAPDKALLSLQQALFRDPYNDPVTLYYTGAALSRLGEYDRAECFYKLAQDRQPLQMLTFFLLIENSARAGDMPAARQYARILFSEFDVYDILKSLKRLPEPGRTMPLDKGSVAPLIKKVFYAIGREAEEKGVLPQ